jgi:hypothetical protein
MAGEFGLVWRLLISQHRGHPTANTIVTKLSQEIICTFSGFRQIAARQKPSCVCAFNPTPNCPITMSEETSNPCTKPGEFSWNELVATDVEGAKAFYTSLFGWTSAPFGEHYTLFNNPDRSVAGLMQAPAPGIPAGWLSYITVEDVDASAAKAVELGGTIRVPAFDIPEVGRIAILVDPQGAAIGIFKPLPMPAA